MSTNNPILVEDFENKIHTQLIARKILVFEKLSSTNDFAKRLAQNGEREGTLILSNEQTKGRGRQQKSWHSPPNLGLWFSLILKPKQPLEKFGLISLLAAVALAKSFENLTNLKPTLKWPNDVLIDSKKTGGILSESQFSNNRLVSLVLGIGINVNQSRTDFPKEIRDTATSLHEELKQEVDRVSLLVELLHNIETLYFEFNCGNTNLIIDEWIRRCPFIRKDISVKENNIEIGGRFVNLDENGRMLLRLDSGKTKVVCVGEQSLTQRGALCYS